eukprot:6202687-Pleurochrysis_carterae.AAC.5
MRKVWNPHRRSLFGGRTRARGSKQNSSLMKKGRAQTRTPTQKRRDSPGQTRKLWRRSAPNVEHATRSARARCVPSRRIRPRHAPAALQRSRRKVSARWRSARKVRARFRGDCTAQGEETIRLLN